MPNNRLFQINIQGGIVLKKIILTHPFLTYLLAKPNIDSKSKNSTNEKENPIQEESPEQVEKEEEIDIDLNDPDVENAATMIQAGFRGHQTRKSMKERGDKKEMETNVHKEEEIDIDLDDPEVANAATMIQAGFRGHQTRKSMKEKIDDSDQLEGNEETKSEEEIDIDLNDPEVEEAASKIQAGFKGMKARKEVTELRKQKKCEDNAQMETNETIDLEEVIDLDDPELDQAATKIQAGFKGMKARKEIQGKKTEKALNDAAKKTPPDDNPIGEEETNIGVVTEEPDGKDNNSYPSFDDGYVSPASPVNASMGGKIKRRFNLRRII